MRMIMGWKGRLGMAKTRKVGKEGKVGIEQRKEGRNRTKEGKKALEEG